jgi:hypothetical protein
MSMSISANIFAYSVTDASHGRRNRSASRPRMNGAARSARQTRVGAPGGGRVMRLLRVRSQLPTRGPRASWRRRATSR